MSGPIHIAQIGTDEALAAILAEQSKGRFGFEFTAVADIATAPQGADVWIVVGDVQIPTAAGDDAPLCIRIVDAGVTPTGDEIYFAKPIRLAQMLDTALTSAKLRRRKQPRALNAAVTFQPFARKVIESASGRAVILTEKEAGLLCAILDAGADGLLRKDAMTELWGYHPDVDSHAVDTTLYRLRQKLQELGNIDAALMNEGGVYKWKMA